MDKDINEDIKVSKPESAKPKKKRNINKWGIYISLCFDPNRFGMVRCEFRSYTTYLPSGTGRSNRFWS